jgi:uncharacterized membrane protein
MKLSPSTIFDRCEFATAGLLTILLLAFHVIFFSHAGPLWRDEISSLTLATKPTFGELWRSLTFDPFPVFYFLLLRSWHALGFAQTDVGLRLLGLLTGVSLIGALWLSSYLVDRSPPLWPLALSGFNPLMLAVGDSVRPYGCGLLWIVLAFSTISRVTRGGDNRAILLFGLVTAVLSVQSNFTNALIIFSIVAGATVVLIQQKAWSRIASVLGIGAIAALSLTPYLPVLRATHDWSKTLAAKNNITSVVAVARGAIAAAGMISEWTWIALIATTLIGLLLALVARNRLQSIVDSARIRIVFIGTTLFAAIVTTIGFLCAAQYLVFPRYFLGVMAIAALCIHVFWNALPTRISIRTVRFCLALIVSLTSLGPLSEQAKTRMTNCDEIAMALQQRAGPGDLIILTSPLYGISFQRYYHGEAKWVALPQLDDFALHRWDLLKQAMAKPDPVPDLLSSVEKVMKSGHRIFLVGKLGPAPLTQPESLPPAPQSPFGWQMEAYTNQWKSELTYWIEHHALHGMNLPVDGKGFINPLEQLGLFEVSGLRAR